MKTCCVCQKEKQDADYYEVRKGSGKTMAACKLCINDRNKRYRHGAGKEKTLAHDRERDKQPERSQAWSERRRVRNEKHPERVKAKNDLHNAVRSGRVVPWPVCAMPECDQKPEAHHPDYSRPLDVVWLCHSHHMMVHNMVRYAKNTIKT